MTKDEILERSRNENIDEGLLEAENKGSRVGTVAFSCTLILIMFFNAFTGQNNHAFVAIFMAFFAAQSYPKYQFTKNKAYLVTIIASVLTSGFAFANYAIEVLK